MESKPLEENIILDIENEKLNPLEFNFLEQKKKKEIFKNKFNWKEDEKNYKIWFFEPETNDSNLFIDKTKGILYLNEKKDLLKKAFNFTTKEEVLSG